MSFDTVAPMTPTDWNSKHELQRRISLTESEDGTVVTDCMSTPPGLSDSNMEYSPTFVLPEIDEADYYDSDDTNMMSHVSRMSAPFIQFAPSILPGTIHEEDLSHVGLNPLEAANKPCHIACVNTINFLAVPEPERHEPPEESEPPVQVASNHFSKPKKRGSLTLMSKSCHQPTPTPLPQGPMQRRLSGNHSQVNHNSKQSHSQFHYNASQAEDEGSVRSSGPSSVRSAPARTAGPRPMASSGVFLRAPGGQVGPSGSKGFPSTQFGVRPGVTPMHMMTMGDPSTMVGSRLRAVPPSRMASLQGQYDPGFSRRSISMEASTTHLATNDISAPTNDNNNHNNYAHDEGSVMSSDTRKSARSLPVTRSSSIASAPHPHIHREHRHPPPTYPSNKHRTNDKPKKEKKKSGMFTKMFSNHVQCDFGVDVIESASQEMQARANVAFLGGKAEYGVNTSQYTDKESDNASQSGSDQCSTSSGLGQTSKAPSGQNSVSSRQSRSSRMSNNLSSIPGSPSVAARTGVRLRSSMDGVGGDVIGGVGGMSAGTIAERPIAPETMKLVEPPRASVLVRSSSGRMVLASEVTDDNGKKGRLKGMFKRGKDKKGSGVGNYPAVGVES